MILARAEFRDVSLYTSDDRCYPGCNPDSDCFPCNPCGPDTTCNPQNSSDEDMGCHPCNPCYPDEECFPCQPCSPDSRCYPCTPCRPDMLDESDEDSDDSSSSSCFITSSCVEALGLSDNCEELQILRVLRDKRRLYDPTFDELVKEYYIVAPKIVDAINASPNRTELYHSIYDALVLPCVNLIKQNRENEAVEKYAETVMRLKATYSEAL